MPNGREPADHVVRFPTSSQRPRPKLEPFETFSPGEWYGKEVPAYDWMVDGCLLRGTVAMLSGDGGIGKSLAMQQLLTAASIGHDWLGLSTKKCRGFGFFCEDDKEELHRRQERINRHYDCDYPDIETLYVSRVGMENVLIEFDRRTDRAEPTPLWDQLQQSVLDFGAQLIVIDTIADAFGGNEIVRTQVRRFITALRQLAVRAQGSVILTAHPSLSGMNSGSGLSGSTAWNNSVRSRLYLTKPKRIDGAPDEDDDTNTMNARVLRTMKNNQGPGAGKLPLLWNDGVFVIRNAQGRGSGVVARIEIDSAVWSAIANLVERGSRVGRDQFAKNSIGALASKVPSIVHFTRSEVESSAERLINDRRIIVVELGPPSKRIKYIRPSGTKYPGEEEGNP